jgi:hypothetical protein
MSGSPSPHMKLNASVRCNGAPQNRSKENGFSYPLIFPLPRAPHSANLPVIPIRALKTPRFPK